MNQIHQGFIQQLNGLQYLNSRVIEFLSGVEYDPDECRIQQQCRIHF